jgi:CRP-like cAMP-binding protein
MVARATKADLELLSTVPLFSVVTKKDLRNIAQQFTVREISAGKHLTDEGKYGREFYVVLAGAARCDVGGRTVNRFERGSFFGELALLAGGPRSATIVAETPMVVLVLDRRDFTNLLWSSPTVTMKILRSVAERLQQADPQNTE